MYMECQFPHLNGHLGVSTSFKHRQMVFPVWHRGTLFHNGTFRSLILAERDKNLRDTDGFAYTFFVGQGWEIL